VPPQAHPLDRTQQSTAHFVLVPVPHSLLFCKPLTLALALSITLAPPKLASSSLGCKCFPACVPVKNGRVSDGGEIHGQVLSRCNKVMELPVGHTKARFRRAKAYTQLSRLQVGARTGCSSSQRLHRQKILRHVSLSLLRLASCCRVLVAAAFWAYGVISPDRRGI
jgi:hypothetical protein